MHRLYDKDFKAKVALEAIRGEKTLQEIAAAYSVHPNLVSQWKKQLLESAGKLFAKEWKDKAAEEAGKKQHELFRQIGQLQVENEFPKNRTGNCTGPSPKCRASQPRDLDLPAVRAARDIAGCLLLPAA